MAGRPIQDGEGNWYSSVTSMYTVLIYKVMVQKKMKADDVQAIDMIPFIKEAPWYNPEKDIHGTFGRVKQHCKHWSHGQFELFVEEEDTFAATKHKQKKHPKENDQMSDKTLLKKAYKLYIVFEDLYDPEAEEVSLAAEATEGTYVHIREVALVYAQNEQSAMQNCKLDIRGESRLVAVEFKNPVACRVEAGKPPIEIQREEIYEG
jgi:hypothetical protein